MSRPFLKYPGSKVRHIPQIVKLLPGGERLVDVFTGGGSVFMGTDYKTYLCADINPDLIHLYCYVRDHVEEFIRHTSALCVDANNNETAYYRFRNEFNASDDPRRRSQLFYYLNRACFNGLCRYSGNGFNVPFGKMARLAFLEPEIRAFSAKAIRTQTQFVVASFETTMAQVTPLSDCYLDPPFSPLSKTANFTQYAGNTFGPAQHKHLCELSKAAAASGANVVLSDHDTDSVRRLYAGSTIRKLAAKRSISAKGASRKKAKEVLITVHA